jgi:hypothetical protein
MLLNLSPGVVSALISAPIAILTSLFAERIRARIFRPQLHFKYEHNMDGYRVDNSDERIYIRVKIVNNSHNIAKSCRAFLVGVKLKPGGPNILYDYPQLGWPHRGANEVDIRKSIDQFLDVAHSVKTLGTGNRTHLKFATSFTTSHLRGEQGYRADFSLKLIWRGSWDTWRQLKFLRVRQSAPRHRRR